MTRDLDLQHDVLEMLERSAEIESTWIGVSVESGIVTLAGHVGSLAEKETAERIARSVDGVRAIANDLQVVVAPQFRRDDTALAAAATEVLATHPLVPRDRIEISVNNGWLTLGGELDWDWQRHEAEDALRRIDGLRGMTSLIEAHHHPPARRSVQDH